MFYIRCIVDLVWQLVQINAHYHRSRNDEFAHARPFNTPTHLTGLALYMSTNFNNSSSNNIIIGSDMFVATRIRLQFHRMISLQFFTVYLMICWLMTDFTVPSFFSSSFWCVFLLVLFSFWLIISRFEWKIKSQVYNVTHRNICNDHHHTTRYMNTHMYTHCDAMQQKAKSVCAAITWPWVSHFQYQKVETLSPAEFLTTLLWTCIFIDCHTFPV